MANPMQESVEFRQLCMENPDDRDVLKAPIIQDTETENDKQGIENKDEEGVSNMGGKVVQPLQHQGTDHLDLAAKEISKKKIYKFLRSETSDLSKEITKFVMDRKPVDKTVLIAVNRQVSKKSMVAKKLTMNALVSKMGIIRLTMKNLCFFYYEKPCLGNNNAFLICDHLPLLDIFIKDLYQTAIIGAGPGGLSTAMERTDTGLNVKVALFDWEYKDAERVTVKGPCIRGNVPQPLLKVTAYKVKAKLEAEKLEFVCQRYTGDAAPRKNYREGFAITKFVMDRKPVDKTVLIAVNRLHKIWTDALKDVPKHVTQANWLYRKKIMLSRVNNYYGQVLFAGNDFYVGLLSTTSRYLTLPSSRDVSSLHVSPSDLSGQVLFAGNDFYVGLLSTTSRYLTLPSSRDVSSLHVSPSDLSGQVLFAGNDFYVGLLSTTSRYLTLPSSRDVSSLHVSPSDLSGQVLFAGNDFYVGLLSTTSRYLTLPSSRDVSSLHVSPSDLSGQVLFAGNDFYVGLLSTTSRYLTLPSSRDVSSLHVSPSDLSGQVLFAGNDFYVGLLSTTSRYLTLPSSRDVSSLHVSPSDLSGQVLFAGNDFYVGLLSTTSRYLTLPSSRDVSSLHVSPSDLSGQVLFAGNDFYVGLLSTTSRYLTLPSSRDVSSLHVSPSDLSGQVLFAGNDFYVGLLSTTSRYLTLPSSKHVSSLNISPSEKTPVDNEASQWLLPESSTLNRRESQFTISQESSCSDNVPISSDNSSSLVTVSSTDSISSDECTCPEIVIEVTSMNFDCLRNPQYGESPETNKGITIHLTKVHEEKSHDIEHDYSNTGLHIGSCSNNPSVSIRYPDPNEKQDGTIGLNCKETLTQHSFSRSLKQEESLECHCQSHIPNHDYDWNEEYLSNNSSSTTYEDFSCCSETVYHSARSCNETCSRETCSVDTCSCSCLRETCSVACSCSIETWSREKCSCTCPRETYSREMCSIDTYSTETVNSMTVIKRAALTRSMSCPNFSDYFSGDMNLASTRRVIVSMPNLIHIRFKCVHSNNQSECPHSMCMHKGTILPTIRYITKFISEFRRTYSPIFKRSPSENGNEQVKTISLGMLSIYHKRYGKYTKPRCTRRESASLIYFK